MLQRLIIFLILNFSALGIGGMFTGKGVDSNWYLNLIKAPWTPPGWVFGTAWTIIMICFAFYMAYALKNKKDEVILTILFPLQWTLNVIWNPVFFKFQEVLGGLIVILALTILTGYFFFGFWKTLKYKALFVLPYFLWLLIATSLNGYIFLYN